MARFRTIQNSFIAGEVSPTALGRTDLPQYKHACEEMTNMIPLLSGGAYRRPGTFFEKSFDAEAIYPPRLIPFVVSKKESYALLLYNSDADKSATYMYIYRPTENGDNSVETVFGFLPRFYNLADISGTYGPYDNVQEVQYAQSVDTMYLVHPNQCPVKILRNSQDGFSSSSFPSSSVPTQWPFRAQNTTATTITPSHTSGTGRTLTASNPIFFADHADGSGNPGAVFKLNHSGSGFGAAIVTAYVSSTVVTVDIIDDFASTGATALWWESSWSNYRGWPRTVCFYQGRLCFGGNASERDSLWFSRDGNFDVMSVEAVLDPKTEPVGAQPFQIEMRSQNFNLVQWMSPGDDIFVGTLGEEFLVGPEDANGAFGADSAKVLKKTAYGSDYIQAVRFNSEVCAAGQSGEEIRTLVFDVLQNNYVADPVQLFYDQYPVIAGIYNARKWKGFAWDESRKTLWCWDTAGNLVGMTRDRQLQVTAWHHHVLGGSDPDLVQATGIFDSVDPSITNPAGSVVSVAVVPNPLIGKNDIWMVVKRKIDGNFEYHVERMIGGVCPYATAYGESPEGQYFVDAAVAAANDYPLTETFTFSGNLSHLEGEELEGTIIGPDGYFSCTADPPVSGVSAPNTFPDGYEDAVYIVSLGLPFEGIIRPVRPDVGSQIGTSQSAPKRIHELTARFYRTIAAKIGRDVDTLETVIFREGDTPMGSSPEFFSGDKILDFNGDIDRDGYVYFLAYAPLPYAIIAFIAEGQTYD